MFPPSLHALRLDYANWPDPVFRAPGGPLTLLRCPRLRELSLGKAALAEPSWTALLAGTRCVLVCCQMFTVCSLLLSFFLLLPPTPLPLFILVLRPPPPPPPLPPPLSPFITLFHP